MREASRMFQHITDAVLHINSSTSNNRGPHYQNREAAKPRTPKHKGWMSDIAMAVLAISVLISQPAHAEKTQEIVPSNANQISVVANVLETTQAPQIAPELPAQNIEPVQDLENLAVTSAKIPTKLDSRFTNVADLEGTTLPSAALETSMSDTVSDTTIPLVKDLAPDYQQPVYADANANTNIEASVSFSAADLRIDAPADNSVAGNVSTTVKTTSTGWTLESTNSRTGQKLTLEQNVTQVAWYWNIQDPTKLLTVEKQGSFTITLNNSDGSQQRITTVSQGSVAAVQPLKIITWLDPRYKSPVAQDLAQWVDTGANPSQSSLKIAIAIAGSQQRMVPYYGDSPISPVNNLANQQDSFEDWHIPILNPTFINPSNPTPPNNTASTPAAPSTITELPAKAISTYAFVENGNLKRALEESLLKAGLPKYTLGELQTLASSVSVNTTGLAVIKHQDNIKVFSRDPAGVITSITAEIPKGTPATVTTKATTPALPSTSSVSKTPSPNRADYNTVCIVGEKRDGSAQEAIAKCLSKATLSDSNTAQAAVILGWLQQQGTETSTITRVAATKDGKALLVDTGNGFQSLALNLSMLKSQRS